jgi:hypothetical protein
MPQVSAHQFSLTKWYMDCVTDLGETAIVYCADLRWHGVHAIYSNVLACIDGSITTCSSMSRCQLPSVSGDEIRVEFPRLRVAGTWSAAAPAVQCTVFEQPSGRVDWNCLQPKSSVRVRVQDRELIGLGCAECLTVTIPPWQLPLRELRWGRFVSPEDSLAWIDWQGTFSTRFAFHNGQQCVPQSISESEVVLPGATLHMSESLSLRSGRLGTTVLPGAPILAKVLPTSLLQIDEQKWRSRGSFESRDHVSSGWVIHEVVHWDA